MNKKELKRRSFVFATILILIISTYIFDIFSGYNYSKYAGWINVAGLSILFLYELYIYRKINKEA